MKSLLLFLIGLIAVLQLQAQDSASAAPAGKVTVTGYAEVYYGFDFNRPANNKRPEFVYSHNRHNEVNLNLGFINANYDNGFIRGNLGLMTGSYANANLAAEPGVLKNIWQANLGTRLSKTANLWLDAGIMPSHIGYESAVSKDCWTLTRNMMSDNTPYYESGAKVSYGTSSGKLSVSVMYLNGWQRISRPDGTSKPSGGLQVTYKPTPAITFNYSNFIGGQGPDSVSVTRVYHNLYGIFQLTDALGLTAGFDYGMQQKTHEGSSTSDITTGVLVLRYAFAGKWAAAARAEYYRDKDGIIIPSATPNGFSTQGYSLNLDYAPFSNALMRIEGKLLSARDAQFNNRGTAVKTNSLITASMALSF
ncbi:MAG: porin [Bacteroidota bacterium]